MASTPPPQPSTPPNDRVYSESHEWHKLEGETLTLGLTQFAVDQLTDVTYVEMKAAGFKFKPGDVIGEVESVKTTSDVYCSVAGEISEVNKALTTDPSLLNSDPYGKGWLVKIRVSDPAGLSGLLDAAAYGKQYA
jgi:glycine cleavage system H protein